MTKAEFVQIAKSYNLSIQDSIFGPQACLNNDLVAALWIIKTPEASNINYATVYYPKRRDIVKLETLSKYIPIAIKSLKEQYIKAKLNQIKQDFK